MGTSALCKCAACGYGAATSIGSGMVLQRLLWPAECRACRAVVAVNLEASPVICSNCGSGDVMPIGGEVLPSGSGGLTLSARKGVVVSWGDRVLQEGPYRCPKCESLELRFEPGHVDWD